MDTIMGFKNMAVIGGGVIIIIITNDAFQIQP
jgi:hypothetical protein